MADHDGSASSTRCAREVQRDRSCSHGHSRHHRHCLGDSWHRAALVGKTSMPSFSPLLYSFMASKQFLAKSFQGSNGLLCVQNNLASMMRLIRPSAARFLLGTGVEGKQCVRACCPETLHVDANATKDLLASSTFTRHNVFFHACLF